MAENAGTLGGVRGATALPIQVGAVCRECALSAGEAGGDGLVVGASGADDGGFRAGGAEVFDGSDELPGGGGA